MLYTEFGKTGDKISRLGFGAMRLPEYQKDGKWFINDDSAIPTLHRAFDLGVNYLDTAYGYCNENSQITCGKALKGRRDKILLSTKIPIWDINSTEDYWKLLESQLKNLDTDYIDYYHFHAVGKDSLENKIKRFNLVEQMIKAKEQGKIRHISFSFHDKPEVMKEIIDLGVFASVLCQYNLLDRSNEDSIRYAHEKGLGVVVMGPIGGGRLALTSEKLRAQMTQEVSGTPEIAMRFVLSNPDVSCALSGMSDIKMVEENAATASQPLTLTEEERSRILKMTEEVQNLLYCTGCNYCQPCPCDIKIPSILSQYNNMKVFGLYDFAKQELKKYGIEKDYGAGLDACSDCGICESKCPQKIEIRKMMKETFDIGNL